LGFLSRDIIADYERYARVCFTAFGDRVKHWITFNEPDVICGHGYSMGVFAPGRSSDRTRSPEGNSSTEPWIAAHNLLLSHAYAVNIYRADFLTIQQGQIGITLNGNWCEPFSPSDDDGISLPVCTYLMVKLLNDDWNSGLDIMEIQYI
jgi:beta-glucosidase